MNSARKGIGYRRFVWSKEGLAEVVLASIRFDDHEECPAAFAASTRVVSRNAGFATQNAQQDGRNI